ncbi:MAG: Lrp/AsnC ligand binding domain-containing protein [Candidatus Odinarchaeum yellowstonii]|uniref:Lrp/AsnC ligand binding domain-containing protein n=1 Tax=Odinarchaeota yellowstonii (strain LCB_4) TaxID=1841599 RepID=A0AAF0IBC8_ODILC|nr:MAG: Lrp/AsnC ligand binding domain-containing protein [Candidatus Odinarchaeum yellowstonii]
MPPIISYILIITKIGREHEIAESTRKIKGVTESLIVYGQFDIVVRIETETLQELDRAVTLIRKMDGVEQTSTLISS